MRIDLMHHARDSFPTLTKFLQSLPIPTITTLKQLFCIFVLSLILEFILPLPDFHPGLPQDSDLFALVLSTANDFYFSSNAWSRRDESLQIPYLAVLTETLGKLKIGDDD